MLFAEVKSKTLQWVKRVAAIAVVVCIPDFLHCKRVNIFTSAIAKTAMKKQPWIVTMNSNGTADILLYGYIFDSCASDFVKQLNELAVKASVINVRINSGGGDVFDGFAIYNAIKQCQAEVNTYVDGIAGSMASIVSQAGKKRCISKVGRIMTHKPSAWGGGNSDSLRENADMLDSIESMMCSILSATTGKSKEDCKNKFLNGKDNWFDAEQALAEGLVDEVYDAEPISLPKEATTEKKMWEGFDELRFAALINQSNNNMEIKISAASKAALGITGEVTDFTALDTAIASLKAKADQADTLKTEKEAAEKKYTDLVKAQATDKVNNLVAAAVEAKKITAAVGDTLKKDYAENAEGLEVLLKGMSAYVPVTSQLKTGGSEKTEAELVEEWDKLDKSKGGLEKVKASNPEQYKAMYKAKFGTDYKG